MTGPTRRRLAGALWLALAVLLPGAAGSVWAGDLPATIRGLDVEDWARVLDWQRKRGAPCEPATPIPNLGTLTGTVAARPRCPLDFAHRDFEDLSELRRVTVFEVHRIAFDKVEYYLVQEEVASARLAAFALLYRVERGGRHGIVAYGPTDGEVSIERASAKEAVLRVVDPPGLDRYAPAEGPDVVSTIALDADGLRLLQRAPAVP